MLNSLIVLDKILYYVKFYYSSMSRGVDLKAGDAYDSELFTFQHEKRYLNGNFGDMKG